MDSPGHLKGMAADAAAPPETAVASSRRKALVFSLRVVASVLLLWWILRGVDLAAVIGSLRSASPVFLALAIVSHALGYALSARRWRLLLAAQGVHAKSSYLVRSLMVAIFFNQFLPSTVGGDAMRAYDSWRIGRRRGEALAVVFVDRLLGLLSLILFALVSALAGSTLTRNIPALHLWIPLAALALAAVVGFVFLPSARLMDAIFNPHLPLPGMLRRFVHKAARAVWSFQGKRRTLASALGVSLVLQANVVIAYYLIARALHLDVPFAAFFLIVPLSIVVMMLPISINAIGLREHTFFFFLGMFGVLRHEAIAFAWIAFGILLLQGIAGGVVYALRR